ncbi:MAG: aminotransferase class V-fold PLP-dependent enzyme [Anaerolineales bacterium]
MNSDPHAPTTNPDYQAFIRAYPEYEATRALDELRAAEYARLDRLGQVYLDYTGGGLYASSQLKQQFDLLNESVFGNPHSINPSSLAMTERVDQARAYVLEFFNAPPEEYLAIFTSNASGALKLLGESYPFAPGGRYLLTFDNHNSVNGIREFAAAKGARVTYVPVVAGEMRIEAAALRSQLKDVDPAKDNLFAYPAQSNFSGVKHPLDFIKEAQELDWDVLLDAAAFVPTNPLDLARWKPDFVAVSFYKMFGFPTGAGVLIARRDKLAKLQRPWFAGGTITIASVQANAHTMAAGEARFEDGTINYLAFPAVEFGLRHLNAVGMERIQQRVAILTGWLLETMITMTHKNGEPLVKVHGPKDTQDRGGTIAFNVLDRKGDPFDIRLIESMAHDAGISLRTGCFCNPGAGEVAFNVSREEIEEFFQDGIPYTFDQLRAGFVENFGRDIGAVRVSVGLVTNYADVRTFIEFLSGYLDKEAREFNIEFNHRLNKHSARDSA